MGCVVSDHHVVCLICIEKGSLYERILNVTLKTRRNPNLLWKFERATLMTHLCLNAGLEPLVLDLLSHHKLLLLEVVTKFLAIY